MSTPRIMRRTSWLIVAMPLHVALAGIPVIDSANTTQATISAIQNVAAVTKQIEQYKTQLQQYQNMLQNTAAPAAFIWSEADQTISKLLAAQDTLAYYKTQAGSLEQYLSRYQDTAHYDEAPCIGVDACTAQDHAAIASTQSQATTARKKANDALLTSVSNQQGTLQTDADALARMQRSATSATGQMQAIQSANQLASAQTNQLLQIRSLLIAQQNALGTAAQIEADRDAQRLAASNKALAGRNSKSSDKEW